ncbi:cytosolic phospholipase A2 zeta-like [Scyliorhinus canicula]|uniref:cytosolic phospholipase A2 zeta-like n=1 Tax=Scyliorhinus canicula TaxID=7830 RepID=UPI0018F73F38|nr:cytosolic phospholipase A2 zeta-like [Scyliorhinus canicula]XP_038638939.1 cytosolic phospholipase A2 zeta-like [Scyliorhinus canicula]
MFMRVSTRILPCVVGILYRSEEVSRKVTPLSTKKEQQPYYDLSVKILRARNIVGGDFLRKADCYVSLHLPTASAVDYKTKTISNSNNPEWDETFNYRIQSMVKNVLELSLYAVNVKGTKHLSTVAVDIGKIELGHDLKTTINLKDDEQLEVEFHLEKCNDPPTEILTNRVLVAQPCTCVDAKVKKVNNLKMIGTDLNAEYNMTIKVDGAYEEEQTTSLKPLSNPVWNENFRFHIDKNLDPKLKIDLIQTNSDLRDYLHVKMMKETNVVGSGTEPLYKLPIGQKVEMALPLSKEHSVDLRLQAKKCYDDIDVRLSFDICDPEKEFLAKRKRLSAQALKRALDLKYTPKDRYVPVVAILASGGGIRAMTSLYGVLLGLQKLRILDCITYIIGVSGSTWCMSTLYQDANWSQKDLKERIEMAKKQVTKSKSSALSIDRFGYYINALLEKSRSGHSVSITDLWGLIIESFLFGKENKTKLSDQQKSVRRGQNPYPIYASLNVRSDLSVTDFGEWFEYTPYEAGLPKYGAYIPVQHFGSRFFMGYLIKKCPEIRLSFLHGQWGSAFAVNLEEILTEVIGTSNTWMQSLNDTIRGTERSSLRSQSQPQMRTIIPASLLDSVLKNLFVSRLTGSEICNFLRGIFLHRTYEDNHYFMRGLTEHLDSSPNNLTPMTSQLYLVDAGFSINSAFPLALRSQRHIDVILSFGFSRGSPFKVLKKTEEFCTEHKIPFPQIDVANIFENSLQECYIFMDEMNPNVPIVIHFPLTNATFKDYKSPGIKRTSEEDIINSSFVLEAQHSPYSTLNFTYTPLDFDKLVELNCYNVMNNKNIILMILKKAFVQKN